MPRRRTALAIGLALAAVAAVRAAEPEREAEQRFIPGDLVLVWARLRDCPSRSRLLDVGRVRETAVDLLDLGPVPILGRSRTEVQRALERRYRARLPGRRVPPIQVGPPFRDADARSEVMWLQFAARELETCWREPLERPDWLPNPLFERIASR
jgi:hypothetical protein